jgi:formylglycine-generating enzyme required for sulfatase activity
MTLKDKNASLSATDYTPIDSNQSESRARLSVTVITLIAVISCTVILLIYQWLARAVIFEIQPPHADIDIKGLSFNIGDNYLLLSGNYDLTLSASGYHAINQAITVTDQATQSFDFRLQPLPGKLNIISDIADIEVVIDSDRTASAPGLIEDLSRGPHQLIFSKYRYFPLSQQIDVLGLGKTQDITIDLKPAWGQMRFDSEPQQASLFVDGTLIGQTPITAEVLETGSEIRLERGGYKPYQEKLTVKAGSLDTHPLIKMTVADGILRVTSNPSEANVILDQKFIGTTPLTRELAPNRKYQVELFKEGYLKSTQTLSVAPEQIRDINIELKPNIGSISLTIKPADAEILVNEQFQGLGSRTLRLSAKPHQITVSKAGYQSKQIIVTPRPDQAQSLSVSLLTLEEAYWATRPETITTAAGSTLKLFKPNQTFTLGAPRREAGRRANEVQRNVSLRRPFYMGITEISNQQFRRWRAHNSSAIAGKTLNMDNQPAVNLSWQEAALYCNWLSEQQGLENFYQVTDGRVSGFNWNSFGYRLPTEAEWAWAAKVNNEGQTKTFPWDSNLYPPSEVTDNYADQSSIGIISFTISNYNDGHSVSAPIGSYPANDKGLFNMSGNVSEWINDYYGLTANRAQPVQDPTGPESGDRHVIRGASWALGSRAELRLGYRDGDTKARSDLGFRIARYVDSPGAQP